MKVLFIPKWDGANPYQRLLMDALEDEGIETTINTVFPLFTLLAHSLKDRDVDIIHIHWPDPLYLAKYGYDAPFYQRFLTKLLTVAKFLLLILDVELARLLGTKIVWTVHDKYDHDENHKHIQVIAGWYLTRRVDGVDMKCKSAERTIRELYNVPKSESINIIPHGHYIEYYENTVTKEMARTELNIDQNSFVYLYFGSMRAYKGLPELIKAYSSLTVVGKSQLFLVGTKRNVRPVRTALKKAEGVEDIITLPKYVPDNEVQLYFKAADVVVLPFRDILGSGSTLLAMSFGRPLVVRRKGCIPDIVPGANFLYDSQIKGLRQAMTDAYEAENLEEISEKNIARARAMDWSSVARETKKMYESL